MKSIISFSCIILISMFVVVVMSCKTAETGGKQKIMEDSNVLYIVKYTDSIGLHEYLQQAKKNHNNDWRYNYFYMQSNNIPNLNKVKYYPEVKFMGKIVIDSNKNINFKFLELSDQDMFTKIYEEAKSEGIEYAKFYTKQPIKYPKHGKLKSQDEVWVWSGFVMHEDEEFMEAFLNVYLFQKGYALINDEVGKKYFDLKQTKEVEKKELLNATILQEGEVIYKNTGNYSEYIELKRNPDNGINVLPVIRGRV
ncbi:hypothetical protein [Endomicrobium proavitum]|uniref:Lipoprotein n=1 Tax=Endomicrobium proavitum TaxID=1408281 RepID=A0A0G3WL51_9BACT|nr:hypothetical protein [Endomicrobium proavitum]AKL98229.1 exported protein of unknown function [Endomicrobium proavitum]